MVCSDGLYNEGNDMMMPIKNAGFINPELATLGTPAPRVLPEPTVEEDRAITRGIMRLSERTLTRVYENEPDIYRAEDLKVRFR
jgi:hypothetical protein